MHNRSAMAVIGAGPAGWLQLGEGRGSRKVMLIDRDRSRGYLQQCIHNGFGHICLRRAHWPEYAYKFIQENSSGVEFF